MFGPFWFARHTARALTPRSRYRSCAKTQNRYTYTDARTRKHGWILIAVLASPLWFTLGLVLIAQVANATFTGVASLWHRGPWHAAALTAGAVIALAALVALHLKRRATRREQFIREHLSPRISAYYTCCGLPAGETHATTCRNTQPPDNPAQWSNRR